MNKHNNEGQGKRNEMKGTNLKVVDLDSISFNLNSLKTLSQDFFVVFITERSAYDLVNNQEFVRAITETNPACILIGKHNYLENGLVEVLKRLLKNAGCETEVMVSLYKKTNKKFFEAIFKWGEKKNPKILVENMRLFTTNAELRDTAVIKTYKQPKAILALFSSQLGSLAF